MFNLKVKRVQVLVRKGYEDKIFLDLDTKTTFPEMQYEPKATIEARQGYGIEWVRSELGIEPEVIKPD